MTDIRPERPDLSSFHQLLQELIGGALRRHVFTSSELELLLDLQKCRVRKSARAELLRRYMRAVQQHHAADGEVPLRLSDFVEREQRYSSVRAERRRAAVLAEAPCSG